MENDTSTSNLRGQRTLATVAFTDCVGFSARMSINEDHTLDLIRRDLKMMRRICERFEGRVLKSTGDGLLMYFISGVKAVECAIDIQRLIRKQAAVLPPEDCLQHRIGIHLSDMFITETDVMGNGVNIAARLQTEADPGGICISQTVYDVVKSGMRLETHYLGPRELKNIQQAVPAYKILLDPVVEADEGITTVAQRLEQSPHLNRIKKLLLYVCRNAWESDPHKLEVLNLSPLLQELVGTSATIVQLEQTLQTAVRTLSKPAEYAAIAQTILQQAPRLYAPSAPPSPEPVSSALSPPPSSLYEASYETSVASAPLSDARPPLYDRLAQELEHLSYSIRAKKLLLYVCRNRWENDPAHLSRVDLPALLADLHRLAPTPDQLRSLIERFVQTLSKQAEYGLVARGILAHLQPLYPLEADLPAIVPSSQPTLEGATALYEAVAQQLETEQNWLRIKKLMVYACRQQWESDTATLNSISTARLTRELHQLAPTVEQLELALGSVVRTLNKQAEYIEVARAIVHHLSQLYSSPQPPAQPPAPESLPVSTSRPPAQFFSVLDARLGIMRYANPLRAKIVVFSALHQPFNFGEQDWLNLRMHELDGLLQQLLATCQTYTDLEALLYGAARQLQDSEENVPTATAVIKCLRAFYLDGRVAEIVSDSSDATAIGETAISLDSFEESTQELLGLDEPEQGYELLRTGADQDAIMPRTLREGIPTRINILSTLPPLEEVDPGEDSENTAPRSTHAGEVNHARD